MTFNKPLISTAAAMMFSGAAIAQDAPTGSAQAGAQAQGQISTQGGNTQAGASGTASANEQGANGSLRGGVSGTIGSTTAGLSGAMQQRFQQMDSNQDSSIDRGEASASAGLSAGFSNADEDGDGQVNEAEFAAFVEASGSSMERGEEDGSSIGDEAEQEFDQAEEDLDPDQ